MGPLLAGWVDCSEGAIIHQLLVSQPSVQYIGDPQNGPGLNIKKFYFSFYKLKDF